MRKILVANRGEVVRRVARTAKKMGIHTVAVYSDPDAASVFAREADQAVRLRGAESADTYLDGDEILRAARQVGADAVHPGYGFLAENADFARAVGESGLIWIGPSPQAIELMGDKLAALEVVGGAAVPTLPRTDATGLNDRDLTRAAESIGYPLVVKPSAGGGGKGMAVVQSAKELHHAVEAARRQSKRAFGSDAVFLERFLSKSRHIEIQIAADRQGTVRHLFERECSIQRRHQKIIEEAPSPFLDPDGRDMMSAAAVAVAKAVGYDNVGTVEFIVDTNGSFYFLEMNTRLQVEHPVTEAITGIDLVALQIEIARGKPLDLPPLAINGAAIEARLYAEDPSSGFLPASGDLHTWIEPTGVRIDSGVQAGDVISPFYDPMLAKVIAHGRSRPEAVARLALALEQLRAQGLDTNRRLLVDVLRHPAFSAGDTTTDFISRHGLTAASEIPQDTVRRYAIAAAVAARQIRLAARKPPNLPAGWRNVRTTGENTGYLNEDTEMNVSFYENSDGTLTGTVDERDFHGRLFSWDDPWIDLEIDGLRERLTVTTHGHETWIQGQVAEVRLEERPRFPPPVPAVTGGSLVAPMMGTVLSVEVTEGDIVAEGQTLVVVEAMKMEHAVVAPAAGAVSEVLVSVGEPVATDQVLVVVDLGGSGPTDGSDDA